MKSLCSLCVCVSPLTSESPLFLLGNVLASTSRGNEYTRWTNRFLCGPCLIEENMLLVLPKTSCAFLRLCSILALILLATASVTRVYSAEDKLENRSKRAVAT
jgi:hypothetical protein